MLNGASLCRRAGLRELLEGWQRDGTYPLTYVPTVSRPNDPRNAGWDGRTGRVERVVLDVVRIWSCGRKRPWSTSAATRT